MTAEEKISDFVCNEITYSEANVTSSHKEKPTGLKAAEALLISVGLLTNIISLVTLVLNGKGFHPITRLLLQHQALADSFVCLLGFVVVTQRYMATVGDETFDLFICQFWHGQQPYWGSVLLSAWNLIFIAVERFLMIRYPYKHRNMRRRHVCGVFVVMYIGSVLGLLPTFFQTKFVPPSGCEPGDGGLMNCTVASVGKCVNDYYFNTRTFCNIMSLMRVFWFFEAYAIPIMCFIVFYVMAILELKERQKHLGDLSQRSNILEIADRRMTKTAIIISVVFTFSLSWDSWLYLLDFLSSNVQYNINSPIQVTGVFLANLNSCVNPFIYAATLPDFRKSLRKTMRCETTNRDGEMKDTAELKSFYQSKEENNKLTSNYLKVKFLTSHPTRSKNSEDELNQSVPNA